MQKIEPMSGCVDITVPDTGFVFSISFMGFSSDFFLFLAQLCPATALCDMKHVYNSVILFFESPHKCWLKLNNTCTMIWTMKPNPNL
jgi:hypothetical protein